MEGRILFFNNEAQMMLLSTFGSERKNTEEVAKSDFLSQHVDFLTKAVKEGYSFARIKKESNSRNFHMLMWMNMYMHPTDQQEKKLALFELRKIMLIIGGKP